MHNVVRSADEWLALAKSSPAAVGVHDKDGWLNLFAEQAVVEDPVGTPRSTKGERVGASGCELGRFYDAFIAPSSVRFDEHRDIVGNGWVFRDVTIHTSNLKTGAALEVPAILLYEMQEEDGIPKIKRMAAHWEMIRASKQMAKQGARGRASMLHMNLNILRAQGPRWTWAYIKSLRRRVGRQQKELVKSLLNHSLNSDTLTAQLAAETRVSLPHGASTTFQQWAATRERGLETIHQLLASGLTVAATATYAGVAGKQDVGFIFHFDTGCRLERVQIFHA